MEDGVVEVLNKCLLICIEREQGLKLGFQCLLSLSHHLDTEFVASKIGISSFVKLISTNEVKRHAEVQRRALQLIGTLADSRKIQSQLVKADVIKVVLTGMTIHNKAAIVAQWGCWALFNLCFEYPVALSKAPGGDGTQMLQKVKKLMCEHENSEAVQLQGCLVMLASCQGEPGSIKNLQVANDAGVLEAVVDARERWPKNEQISGICRKLLQSMSDFNS